MPTHEPSSVDSTCGGRATAMPPIGTCKMGIDALAVVDADGAIPYAKVLQDVAMHCRYGQTVVVFLSEPEARVSATVQAIALLRARGANVLAIEFERGSFLDEKAPPSGAGASTST